MNPHEQKLIRSVRIFLNWTRKHDGVTPPFPICHSRMSKIDGEGFKQWRAPAFGPTKVTLESYADGEEALIDIADRLVKEDKSLDPECHDPTEVAVWFINIPNWGTTQYVATEAEAEEWRRYKAKNERSAGSTKRRLIGATPQELRRYKHVGPHHLE